MRQSLLVILLTALVTISCKREQDPFEVSKHHVGLLTDSTQVKDLEAIFPNDSIVTNSDSEAFLGANFDYEIFDKSGNKLLILTPKSVKDSTSVIQSVQIIDARFKTNKNISTESTFQDISEAYKISKINNMINSVLISVNELNASFTIDKKELPANLRFDMDLKIEETHIPDNAKTKYFFINWNN